MPRFILPYRTRNRITDLMYLEQARRATAAAGKHRPSLKDLEGELANYCNITPDSIHLIRRNRSQPSLPVGMKIAEYFSTQMDEVFEIVANPDYRG